MVNTLIMLKRILTVCFIAFTCELLAQDAALVRPKLFRMDQVIHPRVANMAVPEIHPEMSGIKMIVSSSSPKAREHVRQGFSMVHAQWDFEAALFSASSAKHL